MENRFVHTWVLGIAKKKKKGMKIKKINLPNLKLASLIISGEGEALTTKTLATDTKIITLNVELMFILIRVRLDYNCSGSNAEDRIYTGASISRTLRAFI